MSTDTKRTQAELFALGFQYAIDNVAIEIAKDGTAIEADAVMFALATKLGEQVGEVMERNSRRVIERRIAEIIRVAAAVRRAQVGLSG